MAWFTAKEWKNRLVEFAGRRSLKNVSTNETTVYDVTRNEGQVSQEGDSFSATTMNDLEQRISDAFAEAEEANTQLISDLGGCRFGYTEDGQPGYKKDGADTVYPFSSTPTTNGTFFANTNQGHYGFLIEKPDGKIIESVTITPVGTLENTVYVRKNNNTSSSDGGTLVGTVTGSSPVTFEIGSDAENITIVVNVSDVWAYSFGYSVTYANEI